MQLITNKKWDALQVQMKALQTSNLAAAFNNFSTQIFPNWKVIQDLEAYQTMDDIYAVVSKLATCAALVPFYAFDKKRDSYLPDTDPLSVFLENFDFQQKEILYTYLFLTGEYFGYKNVIDAGVNAGQITIIPMHPSRIVLVLSQSFPVEVVGYRYHDTVNGIEFDIPMEDMVYVKMFNPSSNYMDEWRGLSPVKVLARRLTRIQAGEDATVAQLQNGGTPGIVYDKTPGMESGASGKRKDAFGRFLRNSDNKGAPYFSAGELGYIPLGTPLTDLEVVALANTDFDKICNAFGVSSILFNNKQASTESNVKEMKKEMYTNTILPNIYRVEAVFNKQIVPLIKTKGIIKCDVSEIKELHEDSTKQAAALASMYWLTGNEKREVMMYDQDNNDPLMDKYIIPSGMVLLDDLNMVVPPVDNSANDYNKTPVVPIKQVVNN